MRKMRVDKIITDLRGEPFDFGQGARTTGDFAITVIEATMGQSSDGIIRLGQAGRAIIEAMDQGTEYAEMENADYTAFKKAFEGLLDKLRNQVPIALSFNEVFEESERIYQKADGSNKEG